MYAYNLLVHKPGSAKPGEWEPVRPGPDMEIPTLEALIAQVKHDLGFVPSWLSIASPLEYIQVEEEMEILTMEPQHYQRWILLDIEGSEDHVLPPLVMRLPL